MLRLKVTEWTAWASGLENKEAWLKWLLTPYCLAGNISKAPATAIPPLIRRRLTSLGRAVVETTSQIYTDQDRASQSPIIFASRWGDIGLSVKLLREFATSQSISPMGFSTSVHNGIGGIFSIAKKHTGPICALSGGVGTVANALFEAYGYLSQGCKSVIITIYDEKTPDVFARMHDDNFTFSWTIRLELCDQGGFTIEPCNEFENKTSSLSSLDVLRFLVTDMNSHIEPGAVGSYLFVKQ